MWTKTPPSEPGWYWYRSEVTYGTAIARVYENVVWIHPAVDKCWSTNMISLTGEWWDQPIPEPEQ